MKNASTAVIAGCLVIAGVFGFRGSPSANSKGARHLHLLLKGSIPTAAALCESHLTRTEGPPRCGPHQDALNVEAWNAMPDDLWSPLAWSNDGDRPEGTIPKIPTPAFLKRFFCLLMIENSSVVGRSVANGQLRQGLSDIWVLNATYYGWRMTTLPWAAMRSEGCFQVNPGNPGGT
jgi:hypothetical protein